MMRRGSALLVVLGMLVFMVMSAVSFSIYMRQNRLPSSFMMQQASASLIAKAALAEAMHELDHALGDDPYPNDYDKYRQPNNWLFGGDDNVKPQPHRYECCTDKNGDPLPFYNAWRDRVYVGDVEAAESQDGCDDRATVATLPLEGLAYLPPPLVNTVRHWTRHSPSARWRRLPYDAGRWAFTAVNVSDYLDINRLRANTLRDSSPTNRINLAYRFENEARTGWDTANPETFDQKMDTLRTDSELGRLTSMADYNLAIGKGKLNGLGYESLFCKYIGNTSLDVYYDDNDMAPAAQQTFVTDTWYPSTNETVAAGSKHVVPIVLSEWANDPFLPEYTGPSFPSVLGGEDAKQATLDDLQLTADANSPLEAIQRRLDIATLAALADYIDENGVPASLATPSIEHTPMLTGIQIDYQIDPRFKRVSEEPQRGVPATGKMTTRHRWNLSEVKGKVQISGTAVFPFKRTSGRPDRTYTVEVVLKCGFAAADSFGRLRIEGDHRLGSDWSSVETGWDKAGYFMLYNSKRLSVKSGIQKPEDALIDFNFQILINGIPEGTLPIYAYKRIEPDDEADEPSTDPAVNEPDEERMAKPFSFLTESGIAQVEKKNQSGTELKFVCLAWVRIKDSDGNTVDLFPARTGPKVAPSTLDDDDKLMNGIENRPQKKMSADLCGENYPVVPVPSAATVLTLNDDSFKHNEPDAAVAQAVGSLALYCNDPRYNFAPEDWYAVNVSGGVKARDWLSRVKEQKGDDDIFQFVSDAGRLQSMGEMQFLPWTDDFGDGGQNFNPSRSAYMDSAKYDGKDRSWRTGIETLANNQFMWKSHWAFGVDRDTNGNDMYNWGIVDTDGGVTVPRYSSDLNLFMAAIANTPYDWTVADPANGYTASATSRLCFNAWGGSEAKVKWTDLQKVAAKMQSNFLGELTDNEPYRKKPDFASLYEGWEDWDSEKFFGVLEPDDGIHDVDRKFLFSYWKNCFEENQQLFLLFIRAEPLMMMGSGDLNHTPAQLGARAVALVWRDPKPHPAARELVENGKDMDEQHPSHKMRVLFYHQFD